MDNKKVWVLEEFVSEGNWYRVASGLTRTEAVKLMTESREGNPKGNVMRVIPVVK